MRIGTILLVSLVVVSIYILPQISARFSGTHTAEFNSSSDVNTLDCVGCHSDIQSQLTAGTEASRVYQLHRDAAGNASYTANWLNSNITNTTDSRVCMLCHLAQIPVSGSHTQLVVRPCTDLDCHGTNETTNNTAYPTAGNISAKLGSIKNVHEHWFDSMTGIASPRINETGDAYDRGFWTCLGCHTGVSVSINSTEASYPHDNASATARRYL